MRKLVIATRRSPLALWQAEHVASKLRTHWGREVELLPLVTSGDKILDVPLAKVGGKGLFVKEIEEALLDGRADLAVHSLKDVPTIFPPGLALAAVLEREDPRDVLCSPKWKTLDSLPEGAKVGTSSLRRSCQLLALRGDLEMVNIRGNVQTRLGKLDEDVDAVVLARAGMLRLGLSGHVTEVLEEERMLPAVGQGALAIEIREGDAEVEEAVSVLDHRDTRVAVQAERALLARLEGSCQIPLAAHATTTEGKVSLRALVGRPDGSLVLEARREGLASDAEAIGVAAAEELLAKGAGEILEELVGKIVGVPH